MTEITAEEAQVLSRGFKGPRPGSNFFPMLCLEVGGIEIVGERIEELLRSGVLVATQRDDGDPPVIEGGDTEEWGTIPDIDLTHDYRLVGAKS